MKKGFFLRVTAVLLMICMTAGLALSAAAAYPNQTDYVYDGAGVLDDSVTDNIISTNKALFDKVKTRIAVCIVESTGTEDIQEYGNAVFSDWAFGDGVLLLISTGEDDYYAVQSTRIADVLDNERLDSILKEFLEPDFAEGDISRGVLKTVNKLSSFMKTELPAAMEQEEPSQSADEGVTFGGVILSILKIIGWTVVVLIAAFVIFFVAALFNDTAAELLNRLVFSHFTGKKTSAAANRGYYDERLYGPSRNTNRTGGNGTQQRRNPNGGHPSQQKQMYDRYRQGGVRYDEEYYGRPAGNQQFRQRSGSAMGGMQQGQQNRQGRPMQQGQQRNVRQQNNYADDGSTRQFDISGLNRRNSGR